jgi:hypothetical protein
MEVMVAILIGFAMADIASEDSEGVDDRHHTPKLHGASARVIHA